jgi:DNA polymerase I-like protein with 3'-5' exonuclease and polymerase domains
VAKIIKTNQTEPKSIKSQEKEWIYNGLDCCVTKEVFDVLEPQLDQYTRATYAFSRELQGPVLEMRLRGVLVDQERKGQVLDEYFTILDRLEVQLERIVREGVGMVGFNFRSTAHLRELFYDRLGIPPIRYQGRVTVNRNALERMEQYLVARPIINHLTAMRDIAKKISVLKTDIDNDGRIRTSYNIGGTSTGRFSSSLSEFGTGGNLQNIEDLLRSILTADPGWKMGYFDAEQGESRVVGGIEYALFGDGRYLDACESGDLHTTVAILVWPNHGWTTDPEANKELAEQPYYRHYSRRFMCKKIGHGTNYAGKPRTLAEQAKVDIDLIEEFQPKYFRAFPAHLRWHADVKHKLESTGTLVSLLGRKRQFWGRRSDAATLREAIAYDPQGSLADIVNRGGIALWRSNICQLLLQQHDAWVVQYPQEREDEIIPQIFSLLRYPVPIGTDRELVIPFGCKTGWNFAEYCCGERTRPECKECRKAINPLGLKSYKGTDRRTPPKKVGILDRIFC